ncbi:MAG: hypothetical protein PF569_04325 [Candidatus Woesearchaeota archaeon]|jgi:hypothetical protein|nr:hypothetical protein [Candidatus Woesearchaeota archaeon]
MGGNEIGFKEMNADEIYSMFENIDSMKIGEKVYFKSSGEVVINSNIEYKRIFLDEDLSIFPGFSNSMQLSNSYGSLIKLGKNFTELFNNCINLDKGLVLRLSESEVGVINGTSSQSFKSHFYETELSLEDKTSSGHKININSMIKPKFEICSKIFFQK